MWYAIMCEDIENSLPLRKQTRPAHLDYLKILQQQGRLLTAGPFPVIESDETGNTGFSGSLIIAEFDSLLEATHWANNDPYKLSGVFSAVKIKPYKQIF